MSALNRILVRLLFDPSLRDRLEDEPLTAEERALILAQDPRLFTVDAQRGARALDAVLPEYPVAVALGVRADGGAAYLDAFFTSPRFHRFIQDGERLFDAFGDHLAAHPRAEVRAMAALEQQIAWARRALTTPAPKGALSLAPHIRLFAAPEGLLEWYALAEAELRAAGLAALVAPDWPLKATGALGESAAVILIDGRGPSLEYAPDGLAALLGAVPLPLAALTDKAQALGLTPEEAAEVIAGLLDDGLLTA